MLRKEKQLDFFFPYAINLGLLLETSGRFYLVSV
jgi:hypothetical protein